MDEMEVTRVGTGWVGPVLKQLFDLQNRPGLLTNRAVKSGHSLEVEHQGHGQLLRCFVLGCRPCHPQT